MDITLRDRVLTIAHEVRDWTQLRADRTNHSPDDLNGWCAISAAQLHRKLNENLIKSEIHLRSQFGDCHAFVVVDDHVVDVTATQFRPFRTQPVVMMHLKEAEVHVFYTTDKIFQSADALRKFQKAEGWPSNQIALSR